VGTEASNLNSIPGMPATDPTASSPASVCANTAAMRRILLVDDQAHVLRVMKLSLDRNGYEVDTALGGEVALCMLHEQHYDVLITDVDMPRMNGRQLCDTVQHQLKEHAPLTFVIANVTDDAADWVEQLPNTEWLEKPLSLRWIVARLNEYFGHYDRTRAN